MAYDFSKFKKQVTASEEWLKKEFASLRTGVASPSLLDSVKVESYGAPVPLSQVGSVTTEGPRTLRITAWDASQIKEIEKAIIIASLGVSVIVDDKGLRVNIPELTSERRTSIVKMAKEKLEEAKRTLRADRDIVMKDLQAKEKAGGIGEDDAFRFKNEAQKIVDDCNKKLEDLFSKKEKEIAQ
jgi:ribosome recycling factor